MAGNFFDDPGTTVGPPQETLAETSARLGGQAPPASAPVMQPAGPAKKTLPEMKGNFFGDEDDAEKPPAGPAPPAPEPPGFAEQAETRVGAHVESIAGGAQEIYGAGMYAANRRILWQAMDLPHALEEAKRTGQPIANDPNVQMDAKHLGISVDDFTANAQAYNNMDPKRIQEVIEHAKKGIQDALGSRAAGGAKRQEAGAMEQGFAPGFGEGHGIKNLALDAAGFAPDLVAAFGISLLPGGAPVALTAMAGDLGLSGWSRAKDAGADDQTAALYGILNAAAGVAPEMPVIAVLNKSPVAMKALDAIASKVVSNPSFRQWAGATTLQGVAQGLQTAVTLALDKGLLDQNISLKDALISVGKGTLTGFFVGGPLAAAHMGVNRLVNGPTDPLQSIPRKIVEAPHNVMEVAQQHAAQAAAARGEDGLGQVVAATAANAETSTHHDVAATQAAREGEAQHMQDAMDMRRQQGAEADAAAQADIDQGQREAGLNRAADEAAPETTPEQGFQQAETEQAAQKESDYTAARNQQGEQAVEAAKTEDIGAEKGGGKEPPPTLAEALPPEQLAALQSLKERRAAAGAEPAPEPTVQERMRAQAKGTEDDFQELPPAVPSKAPKPVEGAPQGTQEPAAPAGEEEPPEKGPPPQTAQTLAERRQAALDAAMAAKVRGGKEPESGQIPPIEPNKLETAQPNRLAAIRAAVEKRQGIPSETPPENRPEPVEEPGALAERRNAAAAEEQETPPPEPLRPGRSTPEQQRTANAELAKTFAGPENQFVARDADGKVTAHFNSYEDARAYKTTHPDEDITRPDAEKKGLFSSGRAEKPRTFADIRLGKGRIISTERPENAWFNNSQEPMSHDEAREHLSPISDQAGPRSFMVHESHNDDAVPEDLKVAIDNQEAKNPGSKVKGAYWKGIAHVFADAHAAGDKEGIASTALHERTHQGMERALGPEGGKMYRRVLGSLANSIRDTAWAKGLVASRRLDLRRPDHLAKLGDEYAAHLAENLAAGRAMNEGLPTKVDAVSHWKQIADTVRLALRKLGIGLTKRWSDNEVATLIRQAQAHVGGDPMRAARDGEAYKQSGGPLFSVDNGDKYMGDHFAPDHPMAIGHKLGRTMEEQSKYNPGFVRDVANTVKDLGEDTTKVLAGIPLRNIPDFMDERAPGGSRMPDLHRFIDTHDTMDGRRRQLLEPNMDIAKEWSHWQAGQEDRGDFLNEMLSVSNLSGHDPSGGFQEGVGRGLHADNEDYQREIHRSLKAQFESDRLDDKGREIFQRVRDAYSDNRTRVMSGLEARIEATGAGEQTKKNAMAVLRKAFESGKVKGFYSPLQRFGDHWGRAINEDGSHAAFVRAESKSQIEQWKKSMREEGYDKPGMLESGKKFDTKALMERIDPEFVKNVMGAIKEADPTGTLAEEVWHQYLQAMPEMSMRKHMLPRLGRAGFSGDHLRAFAYNSTHSAAQIARLEHGHQLDTHIDNMKDQVRAIEQNATDNPNDAQAQKDAKWAPEIMKEMQQRYDWIRNPSSSKLASNLTRFGTNWYLGASPATAFRIFTQNPMIAHPVLASRFGSGKGIVGVMNGQARATKELLRASGQWAMARGNTGDLLRGDERKAFEQAKLHGMFSDTQTQLMASGGDGSPLFKGPWYQFQRVAGFLFNSMEHHNRQTTFLAGYRMARDNGMEHDDAYRAARNATWDSHGDYTNSNRPRFMQSPGAKVIGLFKQYPLLVTYRLAREFNNALAGETPEIRGQAQHAFGALIGRMMLFAGVSGIPGYWAAEKIVNAAFGSQDEPYDMTAALHKHLNDTMGKTAGDSIMTGPVGAVTGASLSRGASYNDLWYKEPNRNETPKDEVMDALGQLMGPIAAIPINAGIGAAQIAKGNTERGFEHFVPPEVSALMKAYRYATQGATNAQGQNILPPGEEITNKDVAMQGVGFSPQKVADAYARNTAIKNEQQTIAQRRADLSTKYESALLAGDKRTADEVWPQIEKFNAAQPQLAIGKNLSQGALSMARRNATATQGLNLPKGYEGLEEKY